VAKRSQTGWTVTIGGIVATILIVVASVVGYWEYASYVPPFQPQLPPMPSPNGYVIASQALARLDQLHRPPVPRTWPNGSPAELRAQLAVVRPILKQVRAALHLEWRSPPELGLNSVSPELSGSDGRFRECARCFAAESILQRDEGNYAGAMQSSLDAMQLGSKIPWGGGLIARLVGLACHAIGFDMAERTASHLPAGAIPAALQRARRLRWDWPPLAETLENERIANLSMGTEAFQEIRRQPIYEQVNYFRGTDLSFSDAVRFLLTPRRTVLVNEDRFFAQEITESRKPFRQRVAEPLPDDPWSSHMLMSIDPANLVRWERAATHLAMLEVALAVRMHYLEHGRYPGRLSDISKKWLPAVPTDLWDQPIAYRLKGGQPVIYSLGPDGKDDGGRPADPIGLTPTSRGDLVFGKMSHRLSSQPAHAGVPAPH
jgi:hypothetical protein